MALWVECRTTHRLFCRTSTFFTTLRRFGMIHENLETRPDEYTKSRQFAFRIDQDPSSTVATTLLSLRVLYTSFLLSPFHTTAATNFSGAIPSANTFPRSLFHFSLSNTPSTHHSTCRYRPLSLSHQPFFKYPTSHSNTRRYSFLFQPLTFQLIAPIFSWNSLW